MGKFVQIVEYTTTRFDEVKKLGEDYRDNGAGRGGLRRVTITSDRDRPNTYITVAEFDSYDAAMQNSQRQETTQFAEQMQKLCDGPPKFYNLDVRDMYEIS